MAASAVSENHISMPCQEMKPACTVWYTLWHYLHIIHNSLMGVPASGLQDMYSTIDEAVKLVVANKVDRSTEREVTFEQGAAFAKKVRSSMLRNQQ